MAVTLLETPRTPYLPFPHTTAEWRGGDQPLRNVLLPAGSASWKSPSTKEDYHERSGGF
jgi:hypothetical protein